MNSIMGECSLYGECSLEHIQGESQMLLLLCVCLRRASKSMCREAWIQKRELGALGRRGHALPCGGRSPKLLCALAFPGVALIYPEGHTAGGLACTLGTAAALGTIFLQTVLSGNTALKGSPSL